MPVQRCVSKTHFLTFIACGILVHGSEYWHIRNWGTKHAH
jgi:hypothetical protein